MKATDLLYKAKRIDNGEWVMGSHIEKAICNLIGSRGDIRTYEINPETLCVGFKDERGKEWFQGDMVLWAEYGARGVIEFSVNGFSVNFVDSTRMLSDCIKYITVTGNIHDNAS